MKQAQLDKLHEILLMLANEVDRICKKNNINYSIIGGTMLGAVRHKGFIPWDDDIDIGLLRNEYQRFLDACKTDLDERFELVNTSTDSDYVYGFSKMLIKGTNFVQKGHENTTNKKGIFIDIFPYDVIPDSSFKRRIQKFKNYFYIKMLRQKSKVADEQNWGIKEKLIFRILDFLCIFRTKKSLVMALEKNMIKYNKTDGKYVSNMSGFYGYTKETLPKNYFDSYKRMEFENSELEVISKNIQALETIYGDYMQLPPVEQRRTHEFVILDFGEY